MTQASPLVSILVVGLGLAFVLGTIASRLRLPPIAGYLLAGVAVGPFTPGFVADPRLALQLADVGVILLMFGVGLHFSVKDLLSVRGIALPGAVLQLVFSTLIGTGIAVLLGWRMPGGAAFGFALSIASTVVVMRTLQERRLIETDRGRITAGWLVVQDLVTVLWLVLLPSLAAALGNRAGHGLAGAELVPFARNLALTLLKLVAFAALMWIVGRRVIPAILHYVAHTGSRELFRLAVLSVALGVAFGASELFGVSIALGAFLAGMILSESQLSQRAAEESLPLRDAFAVLFFVAVGMLFNPHVLIDQPVHLAMTVCAVVIAIPAVTFAIARALGLKSPAALFVGGGIAQIGEFSFILVNLCIGLNLLPRDARDLVVGTSILSILANPLIRNLAARAERRRATQSAAESAPEAFAPTSLTAHAIVVGYGRVGSLVAQGLKADGARFLVIEESPDAAERLRGEGMEFLSGNAADERVLMAANLGQARMIFIAIPQAFEAGQIVEQARRANPRIEIVARAHFDAEVDHLLQYGANKVIMGEREIAHAMLEHARAAALAFAAGERENKPG